MDELRYNREALIKEGSSTEIVDRLVAQVASSSTIETAQALLGELEPEANNLGWPLDRDYAAVALQYSADQATHEVGKAMLQFALGRAEWCASCATAGGEGIARSRHVKELDAQIRAHA